MLNEKILHFCSNFKWRMVVQKSQLMTESQSTRYTIGVGTYILLSSPHFVFVFFLRSFLPSFLTCILNLVPFTRTWSVEALTLLTSVWKEPSSNIGREIVYADRGFSWLASIPPGGCQESNFKLGHDSFLSKSFNSLFKHLPFQCYHSLSF